MTTGSSVIQDKDGNFVVAVSQITKDSTIHANVRQEYLILTEDKVRLCLRDHVTTLEKKAAWQAPLGVFLALLLALVTTDFKDAIGVTKDAWHAFFLMALILSLVWLARTSYTAIKAPTLDEVVAVLKKGATPTTQDQDPAKPASDGSKTV